MGNMSLMHRKMCVVCTLIWTLLHFVSAQACTIFVLADAERVLFCNNEDCKNIHTRIWFVPAGKHKLGCGYVGLRNQWAQGGMNTKGLAFDYVAGFTLDGVADASPIVVQPKLKRVRGNPSERMLESCGDVEEAIAFYGSHQEPTFSYAAMMVADRSGAFAVIGFKSGRLHVVRGKGCGVWGWNAGVADTLISQNSTPVLTNAAMILDKARSHDEYATKYSNIFDLRTGEISLFDFSKTPTATSLSLAEELGKGCHFYDMPQIQAQLKEKPRRLSRCKECMKNLFCWLHLND